VLKAAGVEWPSKNIDFGQLGYVSAALAAATLGLDRYFGFSSGWVRYILADLNIRKALAEFQMNWIIANTCLENDAEETKCARKRLQLLKDFSIKITDLVDEESRQWAAEFQGELAALNTSVKNVQDAAKPGTIAVSITRDPTVIPDIVVFLDGQQRESSQSSTILLNGIGPGAHQVTVTGARRDGTPVQDSKAVVVASGTVANVTVHLQ
jgi:SMODS and SLOG-associating 2TM effector domain 2